MNNDYDKKTNNINGTTQGIKIKTEPGLSSPTRLSSFKPPRDLTLGGNKAATKKVFVPNLNAIRNKSKVVVSSDGAGERRRGERGRGARGAGGKGGAGRGSNILRATGVFSEGIAAGTARHSSRGYSGGARESGGGEGGAVALAKPTLKVKQEWKVDKDIEEQQIKELTNDEDEDMLVGGTLPPTRLPINTLCSYSSTKGPEPLKSLPIKREIKSEPTHDIPMTDEQIDTKHRKDKKIKLEYSYSKETVNLLQTKKPSLLLLQFPDSLPGRGPDDEPAEKDKKSDNAEPVQKTQHNICSAKHLEEGQIGKIVIHKSGKIKMVIGNTMYDLSLGTQACFRQDVVSVRTCPAERSGSMVNLGSIQSKLTATPDWETLFQQMETK